MVNMILYNQNTASIYGFFGTPFPTDEEAIEKCFPSEDWNEGYIITESDKVIYLDDLKTSVVIGDMENIYLDFDSGEAYTKDEIKEACVVMSDEEFDAYIEERFQRGLERNGGLIKMETVG